MATRMGGVVKALVEALPGRTFLDLRLAENRSVSRRAGRPVPLWLMTSHTTDGPIREALGAQVDGYHLATFPQRLSLRVNPGGRLFRDPEGRPSEHAPGHGDLPDALADSGLLDRFIDQGGRTLMVANLDNLGATLDPLLIGWHIEHGKAVSCEVVDKVGSDRGGIPVRLDGRPVVLEEFRLPRGFDPARVRVFSTNSFHFDAEALERLDMPWTYFIVEKTVEGLKAIQFERLIGEVTSYLDTRFVRVPRSGARSRFLPVKDREELQARQAELVLVARDRGMLD
jgi:UTP--glucose-1-phosphate uridylyltransferase